MKKLNTLLILFVVLFIGITACSNEYPEEIEPDKGKFKYEQVVEGLSLPWGIVFLPDGDWLVSEKTGELKRIRDGKVIGEISGAPDIYLNGQGGFLDLELHPDFANNKLLYMSYSSEEGSGEGGNTAIARARLDGDRLTALEVLYKGVPNSTSSAHFGSRLEFDKDGYLYFSIGDRRNRDVNPQDITRDGGKIYRIHDDGRIPSDNPFINDNSAKKAIYSYGHRNPQGMAMNPATGKIWTHEHGPRGGDEINVIEPGKNYGWPVITYGINYNGTKITDLTEKDGMEQPEVYWDPSIAPSGMAFITSDKYPGYTNDLLVGSLKFNYLVLCKTEGDNVVSQEIVAEKIGRVRTVRQAPDGFIYVMVEGKGIFRLELE